MKIALVTGTTSGIGYEITKKLLNMNYIVYGIGRDFSKNLIENDNFIKIKCDLLKESELDKTLISLKKISFNLIVNVAGIGYFGLHEELNISKIKKMITLNLEVPLIISHYFLRKIKENKGMIINISSITAKKESPLGAVYSATKAGLSQFGISLFEEVRKHGVKIVNIHPDMTKTNFYENTFFECDDDKNSYINTWNISEAIEFILNQDNNIVITDITLRPQKHIIKRKRKE